VTGGAGFIGSRLVKKLLNLGCEVYVADNFSRGSKENLEPFLDKIHLYPVDLTKLENCLRVTKDVDYVFHLAAAVGGIHYIKKENVGGSTPSLLMNTNMLEAARINDIKKFLFTSSACVYREKNSSLNKFKEEDAYPANPLTTYGWVKLMGEIQCRSYYLDYGIKSSVVRIFNAYGEKENLDSKWSHVIPSLIRKAILYPKEEFRIFGDGSQERAFLYIKDCIDGLLLSMEKITDADPINMGSEEIVSINELATKIIKLSGKNIDVKYDQYGPQGTYRYCADITKMKKVLGWEPQISLDEGLRRTYEWAKRKLNVER
jgi:nucleoside-diphosphate-sugar epimerase